MAFVEKVKKYFQPFEVCKLCHMAVYQVKHKLKLDTSDGTQYITICDTCADLLDQMAHSQRPNDE